MLSTIYFFYIFFVYLYIFFFFFFFFSSRRRHTRFDCDWSSDVCSSDLFYNVEILFARTVRYVLAENDDARIALHLDRKSTRLNSSHSQISYAVFCLKKKNKSTGAHASRAERGGAMQQRRAPADEIRRTT